MSTMEFPQSIQIPGGGGPPGGPPGAPPSDQGADTGAPPDPTSDPEGALSFALDYLRQLATAEPDDSDTAIIDACLAKLSSIGGARQKANESALGVTPAHKAMGRASKSSSGGGGY